MSLVFRTYSTAQCRWTSSTSLDLLTCAPTTPLLCPASTSVAVELTQASLHDEKLSHQCALSFFTAGGGVMGSPGRLAALTVLDGL